MKTSKSKTFQKGDDINQVLEFIGKDGLFELDESILKQKYIVYVVKLSDSIPRAIHDLTCPECRKTFKCAKTGNFYCSQICYQRYYRKKYKYEIAENDRKRRSRRNKKATEVLKVGVIS